MIIGGEAVKSSNFFDVHDPATGELVGKCPIADKSDLDAAVDAARAAYPSHQLIFISRRQRSIAIKAILCVRNAVNI